MVCEQIVSHTEETGNLEDLQSAYRANHSTETALLRVKTDIMQAIDDQEVVCLVLLDLSAAFDRVSHDLLCNCLYHHFGFGETVLQWIRSYLSDRTQRVVIDANEDQPQGGSKQVMLKQGVPQGSVLGPILFSFYLSPSGDIGHKHNVKFHGYADDLQNYLTIKLGIEMDKECYINNLQNCIAEIRDWMHTNLLKLNDEKMEFIMIGTRQQLARAGNVLIQIGNGMIHPTNAVRNLGFFYDKNMKNTTHVNRVTSTVYIVMKKISKIRHFLDKNTTKILMQALVLSKIDYCNSLLLCTPKYNLDKLQHMQNIACRIIHTTGKYDSITPLLMDLHWLKVKERIWYKVAVMVHTCVYGDAPEYLKCLVIRTHNCSLRSSRSSLLPITRSQTSIAHNSSFASMGPRIWNDLPIKLREETDINIFKCLLKTYLFRLSYG